MERALAESKQELLGLRNEGSQSRSRKVDILDEQISECEKRLQNAKHLFSNAESTITKVVFGFQSLWDLLRTHIKDLPPAIIMDPNGSTSDCGFAGEPVGVADGSVAGNAPAAGTSPSTSSVSENLMGVISRSQSELTKVFAIVNSAGAALGSGADYHASDAAYDGKEDGSAVLMSADHHSDIGGGNGSRDAAKYHYFNGGHTSRLMADAGANTPKNLWGFQNPPLIAEMKPLTADEEDDDIDAANRRMRKALKGEYALSQISRPKGKKKS